MRRFKLHFASLDLNDLRLLHRLRVVLPLQLAHATELLNLSANVTVGEVGAAPVLESINHLKESLRIAEPVIIVRVETFFIEDRLLLLRPVQGCFVGPCCFGANVAVVSHFEIVGLPFDLDCLYLKREVAPLQVEHPLVRTASRH